MYSCGIKKWILPLRAEIVWPKIDQNSKASHGIVSNCPKKHDNHIIISPKFETLSGEHVHQFCGSWVPGVPFAVPVSL